MIIVYMETPNGSYAEIVAVFYDEQTYDLCLPALEEQAKEAGMIVTESAENSLEEVIEKIK